ncbi:MAG TPA: sulfotransferase, partial [Pseudomonadales bacterium]|nr:sulfotransferase [Pseudomonadales bacterium]
QRALQLKPHYPEALLGIGKLHQGKQLLPKAEQFVLQAIAMDPEKAEFHAALGSIYSEMGEPERAAAQYDNALALDANLSSALLGKGNLLVELGQPEEAEVLLYRALADTGIGSQLAANFGLVQLRKVKAGDKSMQQLVAADAQKQNLAPGQIEYLQFALGKCYDDIGEYDKAFEYYEQGCRIKHSRMRYDADAQDVYFDKLIELFTPEFLEQLRQHANPSDLPVFVLGMPRSGTTLTEQIIASHPQVHGAGELRHLLLLANQPAVSATGPITYPHNLKLFSGEQIRGIANTYIERLRGYSAGALRITDKMPGNFIATGLINALLPNAKIIHVERNPFDTCLSCYMRLFQHGQDFTYDLMELGRYYAGYQRVMAHWRSVLPPGSFYDLHYETLVKDTEDEAKKLLSFCGLEWDPVCLDFHKTERQVRTASVTQVRQPIYKTSVERWRRFEKHLQPLAQGLNIPLDPSIGA